MSWMSHHYRIWAFLQPNLYTTILPSHCADLREGSGRVSLVRLDDIAAVELLIGVSGPDDLARVVVDNGEGGEAISRTELAAPAGGDGVDTAGRGATVTLGSRGALNDVSAGLGGTGANLDAEVPGAGGVGTVADALEVADGPLGAGGHHVLAGLGRGGHDRGSGDEGGEKDLSDLHFGGCFVGWLVGGEVEVCLYKWRWRWSLMGMNS